MALVDKQELIDLLDEVPRPAPSVADPDFETPGIGNRPFMKGTATPSKRVSGPNRDGILASIIRWVVVDLPRWRIKLKTNWDSWSASVSSYLNGWVVSFVAWLNQWIELANRWISDHARRAPSQIAAEEFPPAVIGTEQEIDYVDAESFYPIAGDGVVTANGLLGSVTSAREPTYTPLMAKIADRIPGRNVWYTSGDLSASGTVDVSPVSFRYPFAGDIVMDAVGNFGYVETTPSLSSPGSVSVVRVGQITATTEAARGPRGEQGALISQGPQGDTGLVGDPGPAANGLPTTLQAVTPGRPIVRLTRAWDGKTEAGTIVTQGVSDIGIFLSRNFECGPASTYNGFITEVTVGVRAYSSATSLNLDASRTVTDTFDPRRIRGLLGEMYLTATTGGPGDYTNYYASSTGRGQAGVVRDYTDDTSKQPQIQALASPDGSYPLMRRAAAEVNGLFIPLT